MKSLFIRLSAVAAVVAPMCIATTAHAQLSPEVKAAIAADRLPPRPVLKAKRAGGKLAAVKPAAKLTPAERAELDAWFKANEGQGTQLVRMSDPNEVRRFDLVRKANGLPPSHHLLTLTGASPKAADDKCEALLNSGKVDGMFLSVGAASQAPTTDLSASTLQSVYVNEPTQGYGSAINVFDSDENLVASGGGDSPAGQPLLVTDADPSPGTYKVDDPPVAFAWFTVYTADSGMPCRYRVQQSILPPVQKITVQAPNNDKNRKTVLCINRDEDGPGWTDKCDFGPFPQAKLDNGVWSVVVPLKGSIELPGLYASDKGVTLRTYVVNSQDGNSCTDVKDLAKQVLDNMVVTRNEKGNDVLSWSLLGDKAPLAGKTCYSMHSGLKFNMTWNNIFVRKTPDSKPFALTAIISNSIGQSTPNSLKIAEVDLQWGCLPIGAQITMADGSRKAIEDITREDRVLGADGKPWEIVSKMKGDDFGLVEITAADGTVTRMTREHPVVIGEEADGRPRAVTAAEIREGMPLTTAKGKTTIASFKNVPYDGKVYNLEVRPLGAKEGPAGGGMFFADGMLVGDQAMQGKVGRVLARVPDAAE